MKLGCILTKEQFDQLFGRLDEAIGRDDDPVIQWYKSEGMRKLQNVVWIEYLSKAILGYEGHPGPDKEEDFEKWLTVIDDDTSEEFRQAAA